MCFYLIFNEPKKINLQSDIVQKQYPQFLCHLSKLSTDNLIMTTSNSAHCWRIISLFGTWWCKPLSFFSMLQIVLWVIKNLFAGKGAVIDIAHLIIYLLKMFVFAVYCHENWFSRLSLHVTLGTCICFWLKTILIRICATPKQLIKLKILTVDLMTENVKWLMQWSYLFFQNEECSEFSFST